MNSNFYLGNQDYRYFGKEIVNCDPETPHTMIPLRQDGFGQGYKQHQKQIYQFNKPIRYHRQCESIPEDKENNPRNKIQTEILEMICSYDFNSNKAELNDFDKQVYDDPHFVALYSGDIFDYLKKQEVIFISCDNHLFQQVYKIKENYLNVDKQPDINSKMRSILIDWLVDVHLKFKLKTETLYVTVSLIDRYLEKNQTTRQKLQLVGVGALFISCKYEEIYPPDLKDFVYITDNAYSKQQILEMESDILQQLDFNITQPSAYCFLQRYARVAGLDDKNIYLAQYLIELSLIDQKYMITSPSNLACSAIYLVHKIRKVGNAWSKELESISQYNEQELRPIAKELCLSLQQIEKSSLQAVRRKFSNHKYMEVSRIRVERQQK